MVLVSVILRLIKGVFPIVIRTLETIKLGKNIIHVDKKLANFRPPTYFG